jgi:RecA-family ATPase
MVGAGASSKSTLALYAAISVALGRDVFGVFPDFSFTRGRVIFLSLEDAKVPLAQRYQRLLRKLPRHLQEQIIEAEDEGWIHVVPQLESGLTPFTRDARTREIVPTDDLLALGEMCRGVSLLVLDTLSVLCGPSSLEENSNTDMGPLISSLNRIAGRHNCAIVLLHHVAKGDDTGQGRGASAIGDNARWRLSMRVMTKAEAEERFGSDGGGERAAWILVEWTKQNYAPPRDSVWLHREDGLLQAGVSPPPPERRTKKEAAASPSNGIGEEQRTSHGRPPFGAPR